MSKYVIDGSTLTAIADAVREKDGSTEKILVSDIASAITAIPTGGTAADNYDYSTLHDVIISSASLKDYFSGNELIVAICARGYPSGYSSQNYWVSGINGEPIPASEGKTFAPGLRYSDSTTNAGLYNAYGTGYDEKITLSTNLYVSGTTYYSGANTFLVRQVHVFYYLPKEE